MDLIAWIVTFMIRLKRAYLPATRSDGKRILVERLWPRGLSKRKARIDIWLKDAAPSTTLRKWFDHKPERWLEFKKRYSAELRGRPEVLKTIRNLNRRGTITFIFSSRETRFNNAVALEEYVRRGGMQLSRGSRRY